MASGCPLENNVGHILHTITSQLTLVLDREFALLGVTSAQCAALIQLRWGTCPTVAVLARSCGTDASGMTRILDRLEKKGLLVRTRSSEDRRVVALTLTEEGASLSEKVPSTYARVMNFMLSGFSFQEHDELDSLLRRMLENGHAI
jgi:DNA-binding MarR family transcriptional regulator